MSTFKILSVKESMKTIQLISQAGRKLDERIHTVGVSGIAHYLEHGDLTALSALVNAMPKSSRGNALRYWVTEHVAVRWDNKTQQWKKNGEVPKEQAEKDAVIEHAFNNPFYDKRDTEKADFNEAGYLKTVMAKLKKEGVDVQAFAAKLVA